jgi:hypothetical protein
VLALIFYSFVFQKFPIASFYLPDPLPLGEGYSHLPLSFPQYKTPTKQGVAAALHHFSE